SLKKIFDHIATNFQFVDWQEFKDYWSGHFKPKKKIALLTFDDGFREFYDVVAPILERKGIYACNFVNPAFIDNEEMMFRCKSSLLADAVDKKKTIDPEVYRIFSLDSHVEKGIVQKEKFYQLITREMIFWTSLQ
ncbi:polysaccharide deacetylase family protein, partial [Chryseobacterium sp. CH1]|uniref:polysaccharide deacetylase family protein n=1 Tax=Chryseobacterium sp. CH1 TaxID=713551 RepID=UPI001027AAC1